MIRVYTDERLISEEIIRVNDSYFDANISPDMITVKGREYIRKIDNAEIINDVLGTIETPYGCASLFDLSTGVKTLLNLLHVIDGNLNYAINISGCGGLNGLQVECV